MSIKVTVIIEDVADQLEMSMECWEQYLNSTTGEFVSLSDGSYVETDMELAEEIENSDDYIRLPNQYEIQEYNIMENFANAIPDTEKRIKLFRALNGRKPFRNFKDTINNLGLDEAYYAFRFLAHIDIAKEWCEKNDIAYEFKK